MQYPIRVIKNQMLTRPKLVSLLLLLICLFFASYATQFRLDASADSLVLENDSALKFYREIKSHYGSDDYLILTFTPEEPLFSSVVIAQLASLVDQLSQIKKIASVTSILNVPLINSPKVSVESLQNRVPTLQDKTTNQDLAKRELLSSPIYKDLLINASAETTAILISVSIDEKYQSLFNQRDSLRSLARNQSLTQQQQQKLEQVEGDFYKQVEKSQQAEADLIASVRQVMSQYKTVANLHLGGVPMITTDSITFIRHDMLVFGIGVVLFIIITLSIAFGRIRWVVLPLLTCFAAGIIMLGFLGLADWPLTIVSSNFVSLMLILTLSLTIHLVVSYQELHADNPNASQLTLVSDMLNKKLIPCLFTAITTIIAFFSLLISNIRPIIDFGWMMTIGVSLAFVLAFTLFPVALMFLSPGEPMAQRNMTERITLSIAKVLTPNKTVILIGYGLIIVLNIVGMKFLTVENRFIDYFKESTEIYQGMTLIDKELGGTTPLDVIINSPKIAEGKNSSNVIESEESDQFDEGFDPGEDFDSEGDFDLGDEFDSEDDEFSDKFESAEFETDEFETDQGISISSGYWFNTARLEQVADYHQYLESLPETGKILSLSSSTALFHQISPESKHDNFMLTLLYKKLPESIKELLITPYISQDGNQLRFSIRVFESDRSLKRGALLEKIKQQMIERFDLKPEQIEFSGMFVLYNNMLQSLFKSQILTLGGVFLAILLVFILIYRNLKLSLIALTPNIVAASFVLGLMGYLAIPLDIMTITIAAICVGIAVDDSIHYVHRFKVEFEKHRNYSTAMMNSHSSIGRAMYYTSITITIGFSIFALSNFMPSIYFGLLTGLSMMIALIANLTLLPLLLIQFKPFGKEEE